MKKYNFGITVVPCGKITELFLNKGYDFIIGMGYWFTSVSEWDNAKILIK